VFKVLSLKAVPYILINMIILNKKSPKHIYIYIKQVKSKILRCKIIQVYA